MKNMFFASLLLVGSIACAANRQEINQAFEYNVALADTKSVLKIGGYTATGTILGFMGTAGLALSAAGSSKYRSFTVVAGLLGVASFCGAKKSYEKAFEIYKNMKTDNGKEVAKYTALINALGLSNAIGFKSCIGLCNWISKK